MLRHLLILLHLFLVSVSNAQDSTFFKFNHFYYDSVYCVNAANGNYAIPTSSIEYPELQNYKLIDPRELIDSLHVHGGFVEGLTNCKIEECMPLYFKSELSLNALVKKYRDYTNSSTEPPSIYEEIIKDENFKMIYGYTLFKVESYQSSNYTTVIQDGLNGDSGIIDGVYIPEHYIVLEDITRHNKSLINKMEHSNSAYRIQYEPKIINLTQPFYISPTELTNIEYREFVHFVRDSIAHEMVYWNDSISDELALELLNCTKRERKILDPSKRKENYTKFGLRFIEGIYNNPDYIPYLVDLYLPPAFRYYKRREFDINKMNYTFSNGRSVNIYPDTSRWNEPEDDLPLFHLRNMYFWHPAFDNYPVVNISYNQLIAYCHWKERQLRETLLKEGFDVSVELPQMSDYEWVMNDCLKPNSNELNKDCSNEYFIVNEIPIEYREVQGYAQPVIPKKPENDWTIESYTYNKNQFRSVGLYQMQGNVSEITFVEPTLEMLAYYNIPVPEDDLGNYIIVMGPNFDQEVKTKVGPEWTTVYYKQLLRKDACNRHTGARIVIRLTPIGNH